MGLARCPELYWIRVGQLTASYCRDVIIDQVIPGTDDLAPAEPLSGVWVLDRAPFRLVTKAMIGFLTRFPERHWWLGGPAGRFCNCRRAASSGGTSLPVATDELAPDAERRRTGIVGGDDGSNLAARRSVASSACSSAECLAE